jgi:hypothetical protein
MSVSINRGLSNLYYKILRNKYFHGHLPQTLQLAIIPENKLLHDFNSDVWRLNTKEQRDSKTVTQFNYTLVYVAVKYITKITGTKY